jgi:hypothetical protein
MVSIGAVNVTTAAGWVSVPYDSAVLLQPPIVNNVSPSVWSTTANTTIVVTGER